MTTATMPLEFQIRADYDRETMVVYQAYSDQIANLAIQNVGLSTAKAILRL